MGPIGVPEMLVILAIALLIFGPRRLPEFGRTIGKALGEFRRATTDLKRSIDVEMMPAEPTRKEPSTRSSAAAAAAATQPIAREGSSGAEAPSEADAPVAESKDSGSEE